MRDLIKPTQPTKREWKKPSGAGKLLDANGLMHQKTE